MFNLLAAYSLYMVIIMVILILSRKRTPVYPQITPLAPLPAHRAYRPVGRSRRLGEQITQIYIIKLKNNLIDDVEYFFLYLYNLSANISVRLAAA